MVAVATALAKAPSGGSSTPVGAGEQRLGTHDNGNVGPQLGQRSHRGGGFGTRAVSARGLGRVDESETPPGRAATCCGMVMT